MKLSRIVSSIFIAETEFGLAGVEKIQIINVKILATSIVSFAIVFCTFVILKARCWPTRLADQCSKSDINRVRE